MNYLFTFVIKTETNGQKLRAVANVWSDNIDNALADANEKAKETANTDLDRNRTSDEQEPQDTFHVCAEITFGPTHLVCIVKEDDETLEGWEAIRDAKIQELAK